MPQMPRRMPTEKKRSRGRRNRPKSMVAPPRNMVSGGNITVIDTEVLATTNGAMQVFEFGHGKAVRLAKFFAMYDHYRIESMKFTVDSLSSANDNDSYAIGMLAGNYRKEITSIEMISKLTPSKTANVRISNSITMPSNMFPQRWLTILEDGKAFTVYVFGGDKKSIVRITYRVILSSPIPF